MEPVDALLAHEAIRQLASRYALAIDSRDVSTLVNLFSEDVRLGGGLSGRVALASFFDRVLRPARLTFHLIGNHVIDIIDEDAATGVVYCRPEHQVGLEWIVMAMQYWDRYVRVDGVWYFRSRKPLAFYAADSLTRPNQTPARFHFPGMYTPDRAELPEKWPSWNAFWANERP